MENNLQEINLVDCLKVLIKNKNMILAFLVAGLLLALTAYFLMPKTYNSVLMFEIGSANGLSIEVPEELVAKINQGVFNKDINLGSGDSISASSVPDTRIINVNIISKNKKDAANNASSLTSTILLEQEDLLKSYKNGINQRITKMEQTMSKFIAIGQQVAEIQVRDFDLQNQLDDIIPSSLLSRQDTLNNKNIIFSLIVGAVLGIFIGILAVFTKEWWKKNM
jgi:uncharacterized protein involved in exopolysaccharide biosynthesis